jgi:hypothetical protein
MLTGCCLPASCLQSGGADGVERHSCLASRELPHPAPPDIAFVAAVCCCRFSAGVSPAKGCQYSPFQVASAAVRSDSRRLQ